MSESQQHTATKTNQYVPSAYQHRTIESNPYLEPAWQQTTTEKNRYLQSAYHHRTTEGNPNLEPAWEHTTTKSNRYLPSTYHHKTTERNPYLQLIGTSPSSKPEQYQFAHEPTAEHNVCHKQHSDQRLQQRKQLATLSNYPRTVASVSGTCNDPIIRQTFAMSAEATQKQSDSAVNRYTTAEEALTMSAEATKQPDPVVNTYITTGWPLTRMDSDREATRPVIVGKHSSRLKNGLTNNSTHTKKTEPVACTSDDGKRREAFTPSGQNKRHVVAPSCDNQKEREGLLSDDRYTRQIEADATVNIDDERRRKSCITDGQDAEQTDIAAVTSSDLEDKKEFISDDRNAKHRQADANDSGNVQRKELDISNGQDEMRIDITGVASDNSEERKGFASNGRDVKQIEIDATINDDDERSGKSYIPNGQDEKQTDIVTATRGNSEEKGGLVPNDRDTTDSKDRRREACISSGPNGEGTEVVAVASGYLLDVYEKIDDFPRVKNTILMFTDDDVLTQTRQESQLKLNENLAHSDHIDYNGYYQLAFLVNDIDLDSRYNYLVKDIRHFTSAAECIKDLSGGRSMRTLVVLCGLYVNDEKLASDLKSIRKIEHIYSLTSSPANENQISQYGEICHSKDDLCRLIGDRIRNFYNNTKVFCLLPSSTEGKSVTACYLTKEQTSFIYTQLLFQQVFTIPDMDFSKEATISYLRCHCGENPDMLNNISDFERTYQQTKAAIQWCIPNAFIYPLVNEAIRTLNIKALFELGFFLRDLKNDMDQLKSESLTSPIFWHQDISTEKVEEIKKNIGGLIATSSLIWATREPNVKPLSGTSVLFQLECDSAKQYDGKLIIPPGSVFNIKWVYSSKVDLISCVCLTKNNGYDPLKAVEYIADSDPLLTCGKFLIFTNQFEKAKIYYDEITLRFPSRGCIHSHLAYICTEIGLNSQAAEHYKTSIKIQESILQTQFDVRKQAEILVNLGQLYHTIGENVKARQHLERALQIIPNKLLIDQVAIGICNSLLGLIYDSSGDYDNARKHAEHGLQAHLLSLSPNHSLTAISYFNASCIYRHLDHYKLALACLEKVLEISMNILPSHHQQLAPVFYNLGLVYHRIGDYGNALHNYKKQLDILCHHSHSIDIRKISIVYQLLEELISQQEATATLKEKALNMQKHLLTVVDMQILQRMQVEDTVAKLFNGDQRQFILSSERTDWFRRKKVRRRREKAQQIPFRIRHSHTYDFRSFPVEYDVFPIFSPISSDNFLVSESWTSETTDESSGCETEDESQSGILRKNLEPFMTKTAAQVIMESLNIGRSTLWSPVNLRNSSLKSTSESMIIKTATLSLSEIDFMFPGNRNKRTKDVQNLEGFTLAWVDRNLDDPDVDKLLKKFHLPIRMREMISYIRGFQNVTETLQYISTVEKEDIFVVVTPEEVTNKSFMSELSDQPQVKFVYVFNPDNEPVKFEPHPKLRGVFTELEPLILRLKSDVDSFDNNTELLFNVLNSDQIERSLRNLTHESVTFMWYDIMIDILLRLEQKNAKQEMIEFCRSNCRKNKKQLEQITEFEKTYKSEDAALWWSKDGFLYRKVNYALRTQNAATIYNLRFYICDLHKHLVKMHPKFIKRLPSEEKILKLYRGQSIKPEEFERCTNNAYISMNTFFSTSMSSHAATFFLGDGTENTLRSVLFDIEVDKELDTKPYAYLDENVNQKSEREVLFGIGSTFRIESIGELGPSSVVTLILSKHENIQIQKMKQHWNRLLNLDRIPLPDIAWGSFLHTIGEYEAAEEYLLKLLKSQPKDDESLWSIHSDLGVTYYEKEDWKKSLFHYDQALHIIDKYLPSPRISMTHRGVHSLSHLIRRKSVLYNNIARVRHKMGDYNVAWNLYQEALAIDIDTRYGPPDSYEVAKTYNNIGLLLVDMLDNEKSFKYFEKAREICSSPMMENTPADNNGNLAAIYNNIGNLHKRKGNIKSATNAFKKSVELAKTTLPENHPSVLQYLENLKSVESNSEGAWV